MRWVKRTAWALGGVILLLVVAAVAGVAWIDSTAGKSWLEATVNSFADGRAHIKGMRGTLPFHPRIDEIELQDQGGVWATLHEVRVDIAPADLLRRRLTITEVAADTIEMLRSPQAEPSATTPPSESMPSSTSLNLPQLPVDVDVRRLSVGTIQLLADVLGEPTAWTATAAAALLGRDARLELNMAELDPSPAHVEVRFELTRMHVRTQAAVDDPRGLFLRRQLGEALPLRLRIVDDPQAAQQPTDWRGRLTASLGDRASLQASLRLAIERHARIFETDGTLDGARLLPAAVAPLIGKSLDFHLAARHIDDTGLSVDGLMLHGDAFQAEGTADYRTSANRMQAKLRLALPDLAPFSNIAGQPLSGAAYVDLAAEGPLNALAANVAVHGTDVAYGTNALDEVTAQLVAESSGGTGYRLNARGRLSGVRSGGTPLPAHLGDSVDWRLTARSDASAEKIAFADLAIASAGLTLTGNGALDRGSQEVNGSLRLALDELGSFAELATPGLKGRGRIDTTLAGNLSGRTTLRVNGGFDDLATGIAAADALIGGRLRIDVDAQRESDGRMVIDKAALRLAGANVTTRGAFDPQTSTLSGDVSATIDDLAVLKRAGMPASGRMTLDGEIRGSPSKPVVDVRLNGTGLSWQAARVDRVTARLRATMEGAPSATLNATLQSHDLAVAIDGDAALSRDRKVLTVPRLRVKSGASIIEARLRTTLASLLTTGHVTANVPDLAPWSSLAGLELGGRLNLNVALSAPRGQAADVTFAANDLRAATTGGEPLTVRRLTATGAFTDLLNRPTGRLDLSGDGIAAADARIRMVRLSGQARQGNRFTFDANVDGDVNGPMALAAAGDVALERGTTRATLARLSGRISDTPIELQRPLLIIARGSAYSLADLALAVGNGTVEGRATADASRLDVNIAARRLPVALAAHFAGRDDISGAVDARIEVAGSATQPRGQVTVTGRNLRAGPARRGTPTVGFTAEASIAPQQVGITGAIAAADRQLLSASGTLPVAFGPRPGMARLIESQPLNLQVRGDGDLASIADFLPLAGDRLSGHFRLAMDATGPAAQPQVNGDLSLDRGHYENLASGLVVDALTLEVAGDRQGIVIRRLTATDGGKGRLDGGGTVALGGGNGPVGDLRVKLASFQALRRADASATVSGETTVTGPLTTVMLVSRLTVDRAEVFIPDPPPSAAKKIPVTIIDSATGQVIQRPEEPKPAGATRGMTLDVAVHVPGRTFIRGRGLDSEWQGDVQARGPASAPELSGGLHVVKGKFSFFGKDMNLGQSTVSFTGGHKIEPVLDINAETTTSEATFQVRITGTPDDLKINLSSTPAMPQDEILSRLIFGREMTRLTPAEGLQLAQAAATLSSGGPGLLDKIRQKMGLDVLNIGSSQDNDSLRPTQRTDSTGGNGSMGNTGVSGGKYIAKGVFLGAEQTLAGETRSKIEVEVLPHVNVESAAGTRGESVGLNWKLDY